jgi:hypothetical protein
MEGMGGIARARDHSRKTADSHRQLDGDVLGWIALITMSCRGRQSRVSLTATGAAFARAYHAAHDASVGEVMGVGFDPEALATDLDHIGLSLVEDLSPADIQARYFAGRSDGYHVLDHVHFAAAATR